MHARITWGRVTPGSWEAFEKDYRELLLASERPTGLRGRLLVRDIDDTDSGGTVSLWDDDVAMRSYEEGELRSRVLPSLERHFEGSFHTHRCEVRHLGIFD